MNPGQVIKERSIKALKLKKLQAILIAAQRTVSDIKIEIRMYRFWNYIFTEQESIQRKYNSYNKLATWLGGRLRRNKYCTSYIKRVELLNAKSGAAVLRFNNFDLKFKQVEQPLADMELTTYNLRNRVRVLHHEHVSLETLEAEVAQVEEIVSRATEIKEVFAGLQIELLALKQMVDIDLDDCISKINALKQEIYIKYGIMHE